MIKKPALDIAGKIFGVIGTGFGFIFDQLFPTYAKSKVDLNPIESELKTLDKDLNVGISELDLGYNESDEVTTRNADDPNVMSDGSVIRVGDTVGGSDFNPPAPVRQQPLMRNRGGVVPSKSKTSDSKKTITKTTSGGFQKNHI